MDPAIVLARTQEAYLSLNSYADVGSIQRVPAVKNSPISFKTFFVRPSQVRFEWKGHPYFEKEKGGVVLADGVGIHTFFLEEHHQHAKLSTAIAEVTGVSSGAVHRVLKLLLPDCAALKFPWYEMRSVKCLDDEEVNGCVCHHLHGILGNNCQMEVWIEKQDLTVRRLREHAIRSSEQNAVLYDTAKSAVQLAGISPPEHLGTSEPSSYYHEYNYEQVTLNQPIVSDLFERS